MKQIYLLLSILLLVVVSGCLPVKPPATNPIEPAPAPAVLPGPIVEQPPPLPIPTQETPPPVEPTPIPIPTPPIPTPPVPTPLPVIPPEPTPAPVIVPPAPAPLPEPAPAPPVMPEIAYVKVISSDYSDDADPEPEGIAFQLLYYDRKSNQLSFEADISVTIELFSFIYDQFYRKQPCLVYLQRDGIFKPGWVETLADSNQGVRIPDGAILMREYYSKNGTAEVTIRTGKDTIRVSQVVVNYH